MLSQQSTQSQSQTSKTDQKVVSQSEKQLSVKPEPNQNLNIKKSKKTPKNYPIISFLKSIQEEAYEQNKTRKASNIQKAIRSVSKYPIEIVNVEQLVMLDNMSKVLAKQISKALFSTPESNNNKSKSKNKGQKPKSPLVNPIDTIRKKRPLSPEINARNPPKLKKPKSLENTPKGYIPKRRTGSWALLVALGNFAYHMKDSFIQKEHLIKLATPLSDSSFKPNKRNKFYTAWNSMKTLVTKELVEKKTKPLEFRLTSKGLNLSNLLRQAEYKENAPPPLIEDFSENDQKKKIYLHPTVLHPSGRMKTPEIFSSQNIDDNDLFFDEKNPNNIIDYDCDELADIQPHEFRCVLIVDNRESSPELFSILKRYSVNYMVKRLSVGDFIIAAEICFQDSHPLASKWNKRLVILDFLVERKEASDLLSSLFDERLVEQKYRIRLSGISQVIYLIEGKIDQELYYHGKSYSSHLATLTVSLQIKNSLIVKQTENKNQSFLFLVSLYQQASYLYKHKGLFYFPHRYDPLHHIGSNKLKRGFIQTRNTLKKLDIIGEKSKLLRVSQLWGLFMLQIGGCSPYIAQAIIKVYPTPSSLFNAYQSCLTNFEKENLLVNIMVAHGNRRVGPSLSKRIYTVFNETCVHRCPIGI